MTEEMAEVRRRIDECDANIVRWINERLRACQEVGLLKKERGIQIRVPEREKEVIAKALAYNSGPCSTEVIRRIFRVLIEAAVALEEAEGAELSEE